MAHESIHDALARLAAAERGFVGARFLAPVVRGRGVSLRLGGVRCALGVEPRGFEGWGVFVAVTHRLARLERPAAMAERRAYLDLFPPVRLVVCAESGRAVRAVPANAADGRFAFNGTPSVLVPQDVSRFDTIVARYDGVRLWFDAVDPRADPSAAVYLRQMLSAAADPAKLDRPGLTRGHRDAYAVALRSRERALRADRAARAEQRLRGALAHAGATLTDYAEAGDVYRVTYAIDGRRHTSVVRADDLTVHSAGICLSGEDRKFDLASLVGVLREGSHR